MPFIFLTRLCRLQQNAGKCRKSCDGVIFVLVYLNIWSLLYINEHCIMIYPIFHPRVKPRRLSQNKNRIINVLRDVMVICLLCISRWFWLAIFIKINLTSSKNCKTKTFGHSMHIRNMKNHVVAQGQNCLFVEIPIWYEMQFIILIQITGTRHSI